MLKETNNQNNTKKTFCDFEKICKTLVDKYVVSNVKNDKNEYEPIKFITAVNDFKIYDEYLKNNSIINASKNIELKTFDNTKENLPIPKRYNEFLNNYDYNNPCWFVFCHQDWELLDNINEILSCLDKNSIYGTSGNSKEDVGEGNYIYKSVGFSIEKIDSKNEYKTFGFVNQDKKEADTIDCQCVIVHSSLIQKYNLRFDENLEWDLYAEDFSINAKEKHNIKTYSLSIINCHHSPAGFCELPESYKKSLSYLKKKYPKSAYVGTCSMIGGGVYKIIECSGVYNLSNEKEDEKFDPEQLKSLIDSYDVISFDVFDTLILRPLVNPEDVFKYIGKMCYNFKFPIQRELASKRARIVKITRNKGVEDITLDDIYSKIDDDYKQIELDFEYKIALANNQMKEIFDYAKQKNKKIIITSDMYLDSNFLSKILIKNGFCGFDKIYVSSEIQKTKVSSNLFKYILDDLNIDSSKILHIGDNLQADVLGAKKANINSYHYIKMSDNFFKKPQNKYLLDYYNSSNNKLQTSITIALRMIREHNNENENFWYKIGYNYGGALGLFFVLCVIKIAKTRNLTDLLFVARDGYMLNEIYKKIKKDDYPSNHYVYASRKLYEKYFKQHSIEYQNYIDDIKLSGKKLAIVDTCAGKYSAQALISNYLKGYDFVGIYMACVLNYKYNYLNLSSKPHTNPKDLGFIWEFIEFILTSFEPPIEDIKDKKPVYRESLTDVDLKKNEIFKEIARGELDFVDDYLKYFDTNIPDISFEEVFKYIAMFWNNMTQEEKENLNSAKSPTDVNQNSYFSLVNQQDRVMKKSKEFLSCLLYN